MLRGIWIVKIVYNLKLCFYNFDFFESNDVLERLGEMINREQSNKQ